MANWNGKAGKGAMRVLRESKREEAQARQESFRADVARIMRETGETENVARQIVQRDRLAAREQ
jgi:hypothetical protein